MKYIITGHKGLIGEYLHRRLEKEGHECVLKIDLREGFNVLDLDSVKLHPETQKADIFFHLAAHCRINEGVKNPELPHRNNVDGIHEVLEFCRKHNIKKIICFSSSRVLSIEENPYTASKKYLENLCEAYKQCYSIDFIIVRPSTVYGPHHDYTTRLMSNWCINALKGKELPIFGDKEKTLDFTYIDDFIEGVMLLLEKWGEAKNKAYDISGGEEVTLTNLAKIIEDCIGSSVKVGFYSPEIAQPQKVNINISEIKKFGFAPKIRLAEGVEKMISWYKTEGKRWI